MCIVRDENEPDGDEIIKSLVKQVSVACAWEGAMIVETFVETLTNCNYHIERRLIVPHLNKIFGMELEQEG